MMSHEDRRKMGRAIRRLSGELSNMTHIINRRYRRELREVVRVVENARFALVSENSAKLAHRKIQRAERKYDRLMSQAMHRVARR